MVIARGTEGDVGVLADHAPLLIRLAVGPLRIRRDGDDVDAVVDGGFLHVTSEEGETRVDVLADHGELAEEIDVDAVRRHKEALEERLAQSHDDAAAKAVITGELAKANVRLASRS